MNHKIKDLCLSLRTKPVVADRAPAVPPNGVFQTAAQVRLDFYPGLILVQRFSDRFPSRLRSYLVTDPLSQAMVHLDGTCGPIYALNNLVNRMLREDQVLDYLFFFTFFVRADESPFLLVESADDLNAACGEPIDEMELADVAPRLRPTRLLAVGEGSWRAYPYVLFGSDLYRVVFEILADGTVNMLKEREIRRLSLCSDLPILE